MNRKNIELFVILMIMVSVIAVVLVGKYFFNWFSDGKSNYKVADISRSRVVVDEVENGDLSGDKQLSIAQNDKTGSDKKGDTLTYNKQSAPFKPVKEVDNRKKFAEKTDSVVDDLNNRKDQAVYTGLSFHALGEYVSKDEERYRKGLIKDLVIKNIVIDRLSEGNGVSQEFYKVAYLSNMIPAKILEQIVESKEFRDLIPGDSVVYEKRMELLRYNKKITFINSDIKKLLIMWSEGRLSPIQKAWETGAVK